MVHIRLDVRLFWARGRGAENTKIGDRWRASVARLRYVHFTTFGFAPNRFFVLWHVSVSVSSPPLVAFSKGHDRHFAMGTEWRRPSFPSRLTHLAGGEALFLLGFLKAFPLLSSCFTTKTSRCRPVDFLDFQRKIQHQIRSRRGILKVKLFIKKYFAVDSVRSSDTWFGDLHFCV